MAQIMTTREMAEYLKFHEITICKHAADGKIPAFRIGRSWRFDKEAIDKWISEDQKKPRSVKKSKTKATPKAGKKVLPKKKKGNRAI